MKITRRPKLAAKFFRILLQGILTLAFALGMSSRFYFAAFRLIDWLSGIAAFQRWYYGRYRAAFMQTLSAVQPEVDPARALQKQIAFDVFIKTEIPQFVLRADRAWDGIVEIEGAAQIPKILAAQHGVIFALVHFTGGKLIVKVLERLGISLYSMISRDRSRQHALPIEMARQLLTARRTLQNNGVVFLVPDGFVGETGVEYDFFGRRFLFRTGFAELAVQRGSPVVPTLIAFAEDGRILIQFGPALQAVGEDPVAALVDQYVSFARHAWETYPSNLTKLHVFQFADLEKSEA